MTGRVCPWWLGHLLASPVRRWLSEDPATVLTPYVREGMTVLEPGPGMGFFTLPMARMVGPTGWVVAVDIQPKMLEGLRRRASKVGLLDHIETRLARPDSLGLDDWRNEVDFVLAFAVVHEMPSVTSFFGEAAAALRPGGLLLLAEPVGHVNAESFKIELQAAERAGLAEVSRPAIRKSLAVVLRKMG